MGEHQQRRREDAARRRREARSQSEQQHLVREQEAMVVSLLAEQESMRTEIEEQERHELEDFSPKEVHLLFVCRWQSCCTYGQPLVCDWPLDWRGTAGMGGS